ncbi:MAG TPA: exosome complex exonuclease Rrp41 [Nautiliaceae bacterium]|nr:exosome complex exonuclease Rrp41 [Nautiliaceae bacterium]
MKGLEKLNYLFFVKAFIRSDGRRFDELRPIEMKVGVIKNADGSAYFRIGNTEVYAAVYGPKEVPKFLADYDKAIFRAKYNMLPFSVPERKKPGISRREIELSLILEYALKPAIFLEDYPGTLIELFVEVTQADSGTRAAAITAGSLALADAGISMRDLVASVAVGKIKDNIVLDLTKEEEDFEGATDIPIAMMPNEKKITLIQLDGNINENELKEAIKLAKKGIKEIYKKQIRTLKDGFKQKDLEI